MVITPCGSPSEPTRFGQPPNTEIILTLYERHGRRCLDHLPGMFAFAISRQP